MPSTITAPDTLESRRIGVFLLVAFGVSWATALLIYLTGGLVDSPEIAGGFTLATVLLPTGYMFGPAVGNLAARIVTREGWSSNYLRPTLPEQWPYYAAAWVLPAILTILGGVVYFLFFPTHFDPSLTNLVDQLNAADIEMDVRTVLVFQVAAALTLGPAINALFAFGEEFGWRAYLLPKLLPLGVRRAVVLQGIIWGFWHWPLIAMGYNYGFGYPGFPLTGILVFIVFTISAGTILAWLTVQEGSVWPASFAHGAINAIAGITVLFLATEPSQLLGPVPIGIIGGIPWLLCALGLLWKSHYLTPSQGSSGT